MSRLLAILIGSAAFWWASGDWSCVLVFVVPACVVIDWFLEPVICGLGQKTTRLRKAIRLAVIALVGLVTGHVLRVTPQWAFQEALKIDPPPGVDVLDIHRHYEGGPGEHTLIMECRATDSAMDEVLKQFPPALDGTRARKWLAEGGNYDAAIHIDDYLQTFPFSRWTLSRVRPMGEAQVHFLNLGGVTAVGGPTYSGSVFILWEPATNRAILVQRRF